MPKPYSPRPSVFAEAKRLRWWLAAAFIIIAASTAHYLQW